MTSRSKIHALARRFPLELASGLTLILQFAFLAVASHVSQYADQQWMESGRPNDERVWLFVVLFGVFYQGITSASWLLLVVMLPVEHRFRWCLFASSIGLNLFCRWMVQGHETLFGLIWIGGCLAISVALPGLVVTFARGRPPGWRRIDRERLGVSDLLMLTALFAIVMLWVRTAPEDAFEGESPKTVAIVYFIVLFVPTQLLGVAMLTMLRPIAMRQSGKIRATILAELWVILGGSLLFAAAASELFRRPGNLLDPEIYLEIMIGAGAFAASVLCSIYLTWGVIYLLASRLARRPVA